MSAGLKAFLFVLIPVGALFLAPVVGKVPAALFVVAGLYVLTFMAKAMPSLSGYSGLAANGVPARGILLEVSTTATSLLGGRVKVRNVLLDVEVPGRAPFETRVDAMMPANLSADVIPGATMELRIHPRNSSQIAIVGPGVGFAGASALAPPPGQGTS
jgi:hypothetical protein